MVGSLVSSLNFLHFTVTEIKTKFHVIFQKNFYVLGHRVEVKVTTGSGHDVAQLDHGRNIYAKFELFPVCGYCDLTQIKWQSSPAHPPEYQPAQLDNMGKYKWLWGKNWYN